MNFKTKKQKIFFWSPMLSHVGTINAVIGMATAMNKFNSYEVYLINLFGEFDSFKKNENYKVIDIFKFGKLLPSTGSLAKICIYFFSILSIPFLIQKIIIFKPNIIISNLVGYISCVLKLFFKDLIVINSIQGLPKFTYLRTIFWKIFYTKSDLILTMTNLTKNRIIKKIGVPEHKIKKIENPIINSQIKKLALEDIESDEKNKIFKNSFVICCVGRLTRQKNYLELIKCFKKLNLKKKNIKLILIGSGELKREIDAYIKIHDIENIFLLGFKINPFKYIYHSDLYVSTSLWEEPGHTILEAGYLNKLVLSSNCENGPKEILKDGINSLVYDLYDLNNLEQKILQAYEMSEKDKKIIKIELKKMTRNYTKFNFSTKFVEILNQIQNV